MRKTNKTAVSPKIADGAVQWIKSVYPSANAGLTWMADTANMHYDAALDEMKGIFNNEDLDNILDALKESTNMVYGPAHMSGQSLSMIMPEGSPIGKELAMLTRFQRSTLELWSVAFWLHHKPNERDDYKSRLL